MKFLRTVLPLTTAIAATFAANANERWFEMEVILFTQLGDKSAISENFPEQSSLPNYRKVRDLLSPYLQPDLSALKAVVGECNAEPQPTLVQSMMTEFNPFPLKTIAVLEQELLTELPELNSEYYQVESAPAFEESIAESELVIEESIGDTVDANNYEEQLAIQTAIAEAESYFSQKQFPYSAPQFSKRFCIDNTANTNNYFPVENVPLKIDADENVYSPAPYLLNQESLKLSDIVKQLRLSKEFRPLLHIGWRQAAVSKRRAIPVRLYAGENLKYAYEQTQKAFELAVAEQQENELALDNILTDANQIDQNEDVFEDIIEKLNNAPDDKTSLLASLVDYQDILNSRSEDEFLAPIAPSQDWTIDGYFNVHLNHYLYITADFNIANMTLAEQATASLADDKPVGITSIPFKQNRRVISKEVHYFDHPYMGMVVQIRRHKRPEPETKTEN